MTCPQFSGKIPIILNWVINAVILKTLAQCSLPVQAPDNSLNNHLFEKANHGAYSNPGTQLGVQNKDFGAASQTDLTGG